MNEVLKSFSVAECDPEWQNRPVSAIATHISNVYHEYTRDRLPFITSLATRVATIPGERRTPLVPALNALISQLRDAVETHAWTEDDLLFPVLVAHEHPSILATSVSRQDLQRLVDTLVTANQATLQRLLADSPLKLQLSVEPTVRRSFSQLLNLSEANRRLFSEEAGSLSQFNHLLIGLFDFDAKKRLSATQALSHPFFAEYAGFIASVRQSYPLKTIKPPELRFISCPVRTEAMKLARGFYIRRSELAWYSHRILFQAISLFDRYLISLDDPATAQPSHLSFIVCLYLSFKYFAALRAPVSYGVIAGSHCPDEAAFKAAEQFESHLLSQVLRYEIYQPTLFEAADLCNDKLSEEQVGDLLKLYEGGINPDGRSTLEVYQFYQAVKRGWRFR